MAVVLAEGGYYAEAEAALNLLLRQQPKDIDGWLQFALVKGALHQDAAAQSAILQAYKISPEITSQRLNANETLRKIAAPLMRR